MTASSPGSADGVPVEHIKVSTFVVPTDEPEADGTFRWDSTTINVVEITGGAQVGIGYTYGSPAIATLINTDLADVVTGRDAFAVDDHWRAMTAAVRNSGRRGLASYAIAAVDIGLWDLKARLLGASVYDLLGGARNRVPIYGSGGFTSYSVERLCGQLAGWVGDGIPSVKMKVGSEPDHDADRVRAARTAIGEQAHLFVDANGAYSRGQALGLARQFADQGVSWFEEPVSSDDLDGLHLLSTRCPAGMDVTAGEYGTVLSEFRALLDARAVTCLQADVTRCAGISGFLRVGALCDATEIDLSAHTAPHVSAYAAAGVRKLRHLEYFHDHARVEQLLFDGVVTPREGFVSPDRGRPGLGLEIRRPDADKYAR